MVVCKLDYFVRIVIKETFTYQKLIQQGVRIHIFNMAEDTLVRRMIPITYLVFAEFGQDLTLTINELYFDHVFDLVFFVLRII